MSTHWTDLVWKHSQAKGTDLLVLLALADNADEASGHCWPSIAYLARKTRMHEDTVQRRLRVLEAAGAIRVQSKPGRSNSYFITRPTPLQTATPPQTAPPGILQGTPPRTAQGDPPVQLAGGNRKEPSGNPRARSSSGSTIPDDFSVSEEMREWASSSTPAVNLERETESFIDYWREGNGKGKKHKSWPVTWKTWMRRAQTSAEARGWKPIEPAEVVEVENATAARLAREKAAWLAAHGVTEAEFEANRHDPVWMARVQARAVRSA